MDGRLLRTGYEAVPAMASTLIEAGDCGRRTIRGGHLTRTR
jgi:hypothetical protein